MNYYSTYVQKMEGIGFQEIISRLARKTGYQPRHSGKGYIARCVSHNDKKPSLSVAQGYDGRILLHCFSGCPVKDICDSLGIEMYDLFPRNAGRK